MKRFKVNRQFKQRNPRIRKLKEILDSLYCIEYKTANDKWRIRELEKELSQFWTKSN